MPKRKSAPNDSRTAQSPQTPTRGLSRLLENCELTSPAKKNKLPEETVNDDTASTITNNEHFDLNESILNGIKVRHLRAAKKESGLEDLQNQLI